MTDETLAGALRERGVPVRWIDAYESYAQRLTENGVPVIFELKHLAILTEIDLSFVLSCVYATNIHYRIFIIPKKTGGTREICAPLPALLSIQRWINHQILEKFAVSEFAHAYVNGRSIVSHAQNHRSGRVLLKMDLQNFFGSITLSMVLGIFRAAGYSRNLSFDLAKICTLGDFAPQGAATSPSISNIIFYHIDQAIGSICAKNELIYSRYSDDICISGRHISKEIIATLRELIESNGFAINDKKTKLATSAGRRIVTGISIGSGRMLPTRAFRKDVKRRLARIRKIGVNSAMVEDGDPFVLDRLVGKLHFWSHIDPDNKRIRVALNEMISLAKGESQTTGT
ncbi:reverse transcriptase domain-containing protein [Mesorhizobium sp. B263B2A]|uniref:reverse transcriptase domain-containing protein n=1 Tax=Mesorhizobium sp. B263B2A TaxID=2876669 RepID=UPI001CD096E8|nr:reverse transcriptase domain-containing protein [Mesorhizobium sp. B263B2A]MCA0035338.1 reverse transcriptase family protein [Mesorhizobium sp. B263B2A]